ncbi:unnamed protein product [Moneuplotes crassus]|uniref:Cleavage/polyadenylation specificity factor A subunit C-terminal domain-containing protein n=1 Tax=Euplotes crassus TaxID=5936 RepID=A0AAD1X667_EUPCR|nr:unnamed protein product [Moneuplotes crassus]
MDISATVKDLNSANISIKSVINIDLFPGSILIDRDTYFELWKIDQKTGKLSLVTSYKIRNKIKQLKTFYCPILKRELILILIEDVRLIILNFDYDLQEFEKIGLYNFKNYDDLSGKIQNKNYADQCLNVYSTQQESIISLVLAERWIACIRTKSEGDMEDISQERNDTDLTKGEKISTLFNEVEYYSLRDLKINEIKDLKIFRSPEEGDQELYCSILYAKHTQFDRRAEKPRNRCIDVFKITEKEVGDERNRKLIDVKQNEFEGLASFSNVKKIRNQFMKIQPPLISTNSAGEKIVKVLDIQFRWEDLDYYCYKQIVNDGLIIIISHHVLYACDLKKGFRIFAMSTLGLLSLHSSYIKDYVNLSYLNLNFGNNFRFTIDKENEGGLHLLCTLNSGDIHSFKFTNTEGGIELDTKCVYIQEENRTVASGIALTRINHQIYISLSSRYSDFLLYKFMNEEDAMMETEKPASLFSLIKEQAHIEISKDVTMKEETPEIPVKEEDIATPQEDLKAEEEKSKTQEEKSKTQEEKCKTEEEKCKTEEEKCKTEEPLEDSQSADKTNNPEPCIPAPIVNPEDIQINLVDKIHVHGSLDNIQFIQNKLLKSETPSTSQSSPHQNLTMIHTSGFGHQSYMHFLKNHLNSRPWLIHKVDNVDKVFPVSIEHKGETRESFVFSSEDQWTYLFILEQMKLEEITLSTSILQSCQTILCSNVVYDQILQVSKQQIALFKLDFQEKVFSLELEEDKSYKNIFLGWDKSTVYLIDNKDGIYIYSIKQGELEEDTELKELMTQTSKILGSKSQVLSLTESKFSTQNVNYETDQKVYFIGSSNSCFEIFTRSEKIFESRENLIKLPSLITDRNESKIAGIRCFTDFTVPIKMTKDEEMYKHPSHCAKEMHYHTFNNNTYLFVVLINGHLLIYKQIINKTDKYEIRFKKVNIPQLFGKKMHVELQDFSYKEQSSLNFKRARSQTASDLLQNTTEVKKMSRFLLKIMNNQMIYIRDFSLVVHEIQGKLFTYHLTKSEDDVSQLRAIDSWHCKLTDQVNFIIADKNTHVKIFSPQKEFNFGKETQIRSDIPQIRKKNPDSMIYKNICLYHTLKSEDFVVAGCFKMAKKYKEIEVPAPSERIIEEPEEVPEVKAQQPTSGLEKPGFPLLKPIIPDEQTPPSIPGQPEGGPPIPGTVSAPNGSQIPLRPGAPIIHRPQAAKDEEDEEEEKSELEKISPELFANEDLKPLKVIVEIPCEYQYTLKIIKIDESISGRDPEKDMKDIFEDKKEEETPFTLKEYSTFEFLPNEVILDMKNCNLTCDKGTQADYVCIGTSVIKPTAGEGGFYGARILVFEILHDLEKVAEGKEKRSAAIIDCCRGYLISNTEGADFNANTIGFKVQLYRLSKVKKKLIDPNPTHPTKIMATTINVLACEKTKQELILFGDVRKSFTIMLVKDMQNSHFPVLKRAYECFQDISVKATELWKISTNKFEPVANCAAVVSTQDGRLQLYTSMYQSLQLSGEIYMDMKVTALKRIPTGLDSSSILFVTQNGKIGVFSQIDKKRELYNETLLDYISHFLPWQGGLSPIHGSYYPRLNYNHGLRKLSIKPVKKISNFEESFLFYELPLFIQRPKKSK